MTKLVGIVNFTPNSFSDGGQLKTASAVLTRIDDLFSQGADLVDLGVQSTAYGAEILSVEAEKAKLATILPEINPKYLNLISIDTFNYLNIKYAIDLGLVYINDVSGGKDLKILDIIAKNPHVKYICMYSLTLPAKQNIRVAHYSEIITWAKNKIAECLSYGIQATQIIIDPGIGFVTNAEQSYQVIKNISAFKQLGVELYVGHSRKSFFATHTTTPPKERDIETLAASIYMLQNGVDYLRIHNVTMHKRAFNVFAKFS